MKVNNESTFYYYVILLLLFFLLSITCCVNAILENVLCSLIGCHEFVLIEEFGFDHECLNTSYAKEKRLSVSRICNALLMFKCLGSILEISKPI